MAPFLICKISALQFHALNDYIIDYKTRLFKLNMLPLLYTYDLMVLFFIKSVQLAIPASIKSFQLCYLLSPSYQILHLQQTSLNRIILHPTNKATFISTDYQEFITVYFNHHSKSQLYSRSSGCSSTSTNNLTLTIFIQFPLPGPCITFYFSLSCKINNFIIGYFKYICILLKLRWYHNTYIFF